MHILMIAPEQIPVPGSGSVEICILSIASQLANHHKVTILSRQTPQHSPISRRGNLTIIRVSAGSKSIYISSVLRYMKGKHYDFIQVDNRPLYMAKVKQAFPHTPVSLFLHSLTFVPHTSQMAASLNKADLIIVNSTSLKNRLSRRFSSGKHKIRTVYLGVDTSRFRPPSEAERSKYRRKYNADHAFTILYAGRVVPRKGIPVLIQAINRIRGKVRGAKLIIAGKGNQSYMRKLKYQARKLHVPAAFIGEVPHQRIHHLYQLADCFVCPSQQHEAFGLVNVEAMGSGVPVVASNIGGIKEIINHGSNGYLVRDYRNPEQFSHYISLIANNRKKAKELSRMGRRTVTLRFNWPLTARRLSQIYTTSVLAFQSSIPSKGEY